MDSILEHTPLFLKEIMDIVKKRQIKKLVDATFAEGGHGLALARLGIMVLGIEADEQMYLVAKQNVKDSDLNNVKVVNGNYRDINKIVRLAGWQTIDAVIMDLGLSMYQIKYSDKGFSFQSQNNLDLRLSKSQLTKGSDILNRTSDAELQHWLTRYVESPDSHRLAKKLLAYRKHKPINTTADLQNIIRSLGLDKSKTQNLLRQTLQALRIIVNDEFNSIKQALSQLPSVLTHQGLLIILTYHSLEDRLIKQYLRNNLPNFHQLKKPIQNKDYPFARGGKLRIYEQIIFKSN